MKTNLKKIFSGGCVDPEAYHVSGPDNFSSLYSFSVEMNFIV